MNIAVTGSLAYDRIMDFPDRFKNHILPDKVHILNVSFTIDKLEEKFGGTSGNIAHNLKLLGVEPLVVSAGGKDFGRYREYLVSKGISTEHIAVDEKLNTAVGNIITDLDDNQITAFYPGPWELSASLDLPAELTGDDTLLLVAPSSKKEIAKRCAEAVRRHIPYFFDPGQVIPALSPDELAYGAEESSAAFFNDYEWQLFRQKTGFDLDDLTERGVVVVVTQGAEGSSIYTSERNYQIGIAIPNQVLDPTGAGDAFRAGIVVGYANQWGWKRTGQLAATIASYAVEKYGTQEHRFTMAEFNARYQKNFNDTSPLLSSRS